MAINIIMGNTYRSVEDAIFADIALVNDNKSPIVIIVPDQFTQSIEVALLEALNIKCSFNIEVVSFSRLAARSISIDRPMLNPQTGVMLLTKVIKDIDSKLIFYHGQIERSGFVKNIYAVITALRNSAIAPRELKERAIKMMTAYTQKKFIDINAIYEAFLKELRENYSDISMQLEEYIKALPTLESIKSTRYYVVDHAQMPKVKRQIVTELAKYAAHMTVGIANGCSTGTNERLFSQDIRELVSSLMQLGAIKRSASEKLPAAKEWIIDKLFSYEQGALNVLEQGYSIKIARNRSEEVEWVAQDIKRKIVAGARYKDIAVVVPDLNRYAPIIKRHFDSFDHAYYIDDKIALGDLPQIKMLKRAAELIKLKGRAKEWINYLKEPLSGVSYEDAAEFENYVRKYNISYISLTSKSRNFIDDKWSGEYFLIVCKVRDDLQLLQSGGNCTVAAITESIDKYFHALNIASRVEHLSSGRSRKQAELMEQALPRLTNILAQAEMMMGSSEYKTDYLYSMIFTATDSLNISTAPIYADTIFVGDMAMSRYNSLPHIYIIGAEADAYPTPVGDAGILADKDIKQLHDNNIYIEPTLIDRMHKGKFELIQLLMRAQESLTVTSPRALDNSAEFLLQLSKILALTPIFVTPDIVRADNTVEEVAQKIGTYKRAARQSAMVGGRGESLLIGTPYINYALSRSNGMGISVRQAAAIKSSGAAEQVNYNIGDCKDIFRGGYVSISGIEDYYKCPFRHYGNKILKLRDRYEKELPASIIGSFIHRVLEIYLGRVVSGEITTPIGSSKVNSYACNIVEIALAEKEFYLLNFADSCGGFKLQLIERVDYIFGQINYMLSKSSLAPKALEFNFGMDGTAPPLKISTAVGEIKVRGIIDRIDTDSSNVAIIDYKSSGKAFNLKTIYYGQTLQLIVYSVAAREVYNLDLAGLLYLPLTFKYEKGEGNDEDGDYYSEKDSDTSRESMQRYSYSGFVAENESILRKIDCNYNIKEKTLLPLKYSSKKDSAGDLTASDNRVDDSKFKRIEEYALKMVGGAVQRIAEGYIAPKHLKEACTYCSYSAICGGYGREEYERQQSSVSGKK